MKQLLPIIGLLVCLWAIPAHAQYVHLGNDAATHCASSPCALTIPTTGAGHEIHVGVAWVPTTSTCTVKFTPSNTALTAQQPLKISNGTNFSGEMYFLKNIAGGDTGVTATCASATSIGITSGEFSGGITTGAEDGNSSGTGSGTALATGTVGPSTGTTDLGVACGFNNNGSATTWTAGAGFTIFTVTTLNIGCEYQIFSSAINQTFTMTQGTSRTWGIIGAGFQAAGGAAPCTPTLTLMGVGRCG